jgi:hypothetical protein
MPCWICYVEAAHRAISAHDNCEDLTMIVPCIESCSRKLKPGLGKGLRITTAAEMSYHYVCIGCSIHEVAQSLRVSRVSRVSRPA